ncbi:MAG: hypoxanthine phosphoribosyltransferase [Ruminococcus sp.]|jgi:hypoxanthine phosphoribosyltransferase|nr:hypoxanthine phosphoribosyltransferase [Ruminococcus sp.]
MITDTKIEVLISEADIREKVSQCGKRISEKYDGKPLLLIGMLKGSFIFLADLSRAITIPARIEFIKTSSYRSGKIRGELEINIDESINFSDYNVVIVEDIVDTGHTLAAVTKLIAKKSPRSLYVIALVNKPSGREIEYTPDECLFEVGDEFVVGYGLDMDEFGRNLPFIGAVR